MTVVRCEAQEVRHILEAARSSRVVTNPAQSLDDLIGRGIAFKVVLDGQTVGAYLLELNGSEVWVLLAGGKAPVDLVHYGLALIEGQSTQFDTIGFQTRRRGLVKKAKRAGYEVAAVVMRKKIR